MEKAYMKNGHPVFRKILDDIWELHCKKGADYGNPSDIFSNVRASKDFGVPGYKGAILRANDKMSRLKTHCSKGSLENESVEDSLLDLAAYAVIALVLFREEACGGREIESLADKCGSLEISDR